MLLLLKEMHSLIWYILQRKYSCSLLSSKSWYPINPTNCSGVWVLSSDSLYHYIYYTVALTHENIICLLSLSENGAYTHQQRTPQVAAVAPVVAGWGHGQVAAERCNHCRWREEHFQECHNCPSIEEQKAPQDPPAPQDRNRILVALANCLVLFEAGCTLSHSHLNTTADRAEVYFRYR